MKQAVQDNDGKPVHIDTVKFDFLKTLLNDKNRWRKFLSAIESLKKRKIVTQENDFFIIDDVDLQ